MAEFAYNNIKNTSTGHTPFKLNRGYHSQTSNKKDIDPRFYWKSVDKLATELRELMTICRENFQYVQELQKQYHNKHAKSKSYVPSEKV